MHFVFHQHSELRKDKRLVHLECCRRPNKIPRIRTFSLVQQRQQVSLETFGFKMLPRRNFCIFTPSTNTHEAFMREILGKARNICQFIPLFPDPTLDCDLSVACVLNYADQAVRPSRLILVFFQTKKHPPNHVKRPMNAFMVFSITWSGALPSHSFYPFLGLESSWGQEAVSTRCPTEVDRGVSGKDRGTNKVWDDPKNRYFLWS